MAWIRRFCGDASGATAIEYALIAGFVSIAVVVGASAIGTRLSSHYFAPISGNLS